MAKYQIDDNLLNALIKQESGGNINAVSPKGARGLTQIMPSTGKNPGYGVKPLQNDSEGEQLRFTRDYMGALLKENKGDLNKALAAYNAGQGNVNKYGGVPPFKETQNYVKNILNTLNPIGPAQAQGNDDPGDWVTDAQPAAAQDDSDPGDWVTDKPETAPQAGATEASAPSRFLQGVGGEALKAVGGVAGMLPGVSQDNPITQAGQKGIEKATGFAGGAGKFAGGVLPYIAMPEAKLPALLASAGIGAATTPGSLAERAKSGLLSGFGMGAGQVLPGVVKSIGRGAANVIGEFGTHTGGNTIKEAALAGFKGGSKQKAFTDYINEAAPLQDIATLAKKGLANLSKKDSAEYVKRMGEITQDKTILPYGEIEAALTNAGNVGNYAGHVVNPAAVNVQNKLKPIIAEWSGQPYVKSGMVKPAFDPSEAHTIEGLDALKKRVYNEYKATQQGTPERIVARDVYSAVKNEISKQSPEYKKLMEFTQKNIEKKKGIMKELSLGENAGDNAALRKLLSIPRNNANTNFGNRVSMGRELEESGANDLMSMLAGASLSSLKPRGLGSVVSGGAGVGSLAALLSGNPAVAGSLAAVLLAQSPKIMGKTALKAGQAARYAKKLPIKQGIISGIQQANEQEKK